MLGTSGYEDPELLATYGYVTMRLGPDNVARGPYLPLKGGTITGDFGMVIKRQGTGTNSERTFSIRGKTSSSSSGNSNLLTVKTSGGIDYLAYSTTKTASDSLLNRQQIQDMIDGGADNTAYLPIDGGTMTGKIRGIKLTPTQDDEAASKAYADTKEYVHNGQTDDKGRLWTDGNSIFFNPY